VPFLWAQHVWQVCPQARAAYAATLTLGDDNNALERADVARYRHLVASRTLHISCSSHLFMFCGFLGAWHRLTFVPWDSDCPCVTPHRLQVRGLLRAVEPALHLIGTRVHLFLSMSACDSVQSLPGRPPLYAEDHRDPIFTLRFAYAAVSGV
jgi:hypothetical protein